MRERGGSPHQVYLYDAGGGPGADLPAIASYLSRVPGVEATLAGDVISSPGRARWGQPGPRAAASDSIEGPEGRPGASGKGRAPKAGATDAGTTDAGATDAGATDAGAKTPPAAASRPPQPRTVEELARALAWTRVHSPSRRDSFEAPLPAEVRFLKRRLAREAPAAFGNLYDGMAAMGVFRSFLRPGPELPLIFTDQIIGTWDEGDLRYHARVLLGGSPALVSVPGVVVAPARPREYYMYQQGARAAGVSEEETEAKMQEVMGDRYVAHADGRIPEILKGYCLQAVAYWFFGEAFCEDPDCRLFNAHWQEEMIRAQLGGSYELCPRHATLLGLGG